MYLFTLKPRRSSTYCIHKHKSKKVKIIFIRIVFQPQIDDVGSEEKHTDLVKQPQQPNKEGVGNEDELKSTKDGSFETNQLDEKTSSTLSLKDEASLLKQYKSNF